MQHLIILATKVRDIPGHFSDPGYQQGPPTSLTFWESSIGTYLVPYWLGPMCLTATAALLAQSSPLRNRQVKLNLQT